jgi:hypothetical protein
MAALQHRRQAMSSSQGRFFAVDRRTFARVCDHGMNTAVAYLVLACGTGYDNSTTCWSVNAIENYTGISRARGREAIKKLCDAAIVLPRKIQPRPCYELLPACEIPGTTAFPRPDLDFFEQAVIDRVRRGELIPKKDQLWARSAVQKRWLIEIGAGRYNFVPELNPEPEWIWLPNELVMGAAKEVAPIELVRQTQDVMTLRFLIEHYHAQHLRDDGGISRNFTWEEFQRTKIGQQGQYDVWAFRSQGRRWVQWKGPTLCHRRDDLPTERGKDYFRRIEGLTDIGLVEWIPHLFESDNDEAEIIHPYGIGKSGRVEDRLGDAAAAAGRFMVTEQQIMNACDRLGGCDDVRIAPVPRHIENVQMIGIARLRYRPKTRLTAAWWAELSEKGEKFIQEYKAIAGQCLKNAVPKRAVV